MKKVAVENTLKNVKNYLEENNIKVDVLDSRNKESHRALNKYDAIVVTGADENLMGMQDTMTETRVINAEGKTAEEIFREINDRDVK